MANQITAYDKYGNSYNTTKEWADKAGWSTVNPNAPVNPNSPVSTDNPPANLGEISSEFYNWLNANNAPGQPAKPLQMVQVSPGYSVNPFINPQALADRGLLPQQVKDFLAAKAPGSNYNTGNVGASGVVGNGAAVGNNGVAMGGGSGQVTGTNGVNATPGTPTSSMQTYLDKLKSDQDALLQAKKAQTIAGLDKARTTALSDISNASGKIAPAYRDARNQAAGTSQAQAANFAEYLAQRGLTRSGSAAQAELSRNNALQGQLGQINQNEANNLSDLAKREADVNTNYQFDVANANAGLDATALENTINQNTQAFQLMEQSRQRAEDLARQDKQQAQQNAFNQAQLTGYYNPYATVQIPTDIQNQINTGAANFNGDLGDYINSLPANDPMRNWATIARTNKIFGDPNLLKNYGQGYQTLPAQQQNWENTFNQNKFNEDVRQFDAQMDENQRQFNVNYKFDQRKQTFAERQQQIQNAIDNRQISTQEGNLQLARDKFVAETDPNSIDNKIKALQYQQLQNPQPTYDNIQNTSGFQEDYNGIMQSPDGSVALIMSNSQTLINEYGVDGYNKLLSAAKSVDPSYIP